jgi:riboflavin synthase
MFSGIIEDVGTLVSVSPRGNGVQLRIRTRITVAPEGQAGVGRSDRERIGLGDSIAVSGACLTVEAVHPPDAFTVVAGKETLERTTLGAARPGARLHLERALRLGDRLDGHLVSGHVDAVGTVDAVRVEKESVVMHLRAPADILRYIAEKGSICIDGVSLTVNEVVGDRFRVNIVPYTADETLLGQLSAGKGVNLEVDLLARYVERLLGAAPTPGRDRSLSPERLEALGFTRGGRSGSR